LKGLGLATHFVEFAAPLMPLQIDDAAGAALLRTLDASGQTVHTGGGAREEPPVAQAPLTPARRPR
ncbi:hypothetical protein PUR57_05245, partial [Streptomyces sp. JV176]|uniref:hypothetical protein n=1 Tax=Streptomyces sp. JV176 TaxID=858630 RepID=UPI002E7920CA